MKIFVNYRRADAAAAAGRLTDALGTRFGRSSVFMDVDAIQPGTDFVQFLDTVVASASVMLVVIGPNWVNSTSEDGIRRLDNPHDFVRIEIEAALKEGLPIIPILVDGASFPTAESLPSSLSPILHFQAITLRHETFQADVARLSVALTQIFGKTQQKKSRDDSRKAATSRIIKISDSVLNWLYRFRRGKQSNFSSSSPADDKSREEMVLQRLRKLTIDARQSGIRLADLVGCIEETSSEILNTDVATDELEEHLRIFPAGKSMPIVNARLEVLLWDRALRSRKPAAFVDYLVRFPHGAYVGQAREMRDQLINEIGGFDPDTPRVFLNYRRIDSQDTADRIYSVLTQAMPPQNITMDVDKKSIVPGLPIETQLQRLVGECDIMFALIHNRWLEEIYRRQPQHEKGEQIDFVRSELKHALARGDAMPVIPVLGEGVQHPLPTDLPEDIRGLSQRSSIKLSRENFSDDILAVVKRLKTHFKEMRPTQTRRA